MALSTRVLARKVLAVVQGHDAIVARDGTSSVPVTFNPKFTGQMEDTAKVIQDRIKRIVSAAASSINTAYLTNMPDWVDESKEGAKERNAIFALRAIYSLGNSPAAFLRVTWQTRSIDKDDVAEVITNSALPNKLGDSTALFQFRRHRTDENNPWLYSWLLAPEGVSISRGTKATLHKCIAGLVKLLPEAAQQNSVVQSEMAQLALLKATEDGYYWYLSNQNTADHYMEFSRATSSTSCMTKERSFYSRTGARQHPMDCYDNSPHWSLMLTSKMSPVEITDMCNAVIAAESDSAADKLWKYPFLTRTMVLPASVCTNTPYKCKSPYIYGKSYGHDKLVSFFAGNCADSTGLLYQQDTVCGGRIPAIATTNKECQGEYLLPYFDRANYARLVFDEEGNTWWESCKSNSPERGYYAQCSYSEGVAAFFLGWSPSKGELVGLSGYKLELFDTVMGPELGKYRKDYQEMDINGKKVFMSKGMLVNINGTTVLRGETVALYDGTLAIRKETIENTERYQHVEGFGIFDMQNAAHVAAHKMMTGA